MVQRDELPKPSSDGTVLISVGLFPARLAICEDELQLQDARGVVDGATVLHVFDYHAIPSWSITPSVFSFKFRQRRLSGDATVGSVGKLQQLQQRVVHVRLATMQSKQISTVLREHCYKKADEIRRMKLTLDGNEFERLIGDARGEAGFAEIVAFVESGIASLAVSAKETAPTPLRSAAAATSQPAGTASAPARLTPKHAPAPVSATTAGSVKEGDEQPHQGEHPPPLPANSPPPRSPPGPPPGMLRYPQYYL